MVLVHRSFSSCIPMYSKSMHAVCSSSFRKFVKIPFISVEKRTSMSFQTRSNPSEVGIAARAMEDSHHQGLDDSITDFMFGKRKATDVAHSVWQRVVRRGDFVIDATCGNGYDTLALAKMVYEESGNGLVYAMDVQQAALQNTSSLLDCTLSPSERKQVKLFSMCHSRIEDIMPEDISVRLVAFNLGYLPGGSKDLITKSETTVMALDAATKVLGSGGLISIMVYIGHLGGREEYEAVRNFATKLPTTTWVSSEYEILNRPSGPVLIFLFRR